MTLPSKVEELTVVASCCSTKVSLSTIIIRSRATTFRTLGTTSKEALQPHTSFARQVAKVHTIVVITNSIIIIIIKWKWSNNTSSREDHLRSGRIRSCLTTARSLSTKTRCYMKKRKMAPSVSTIPTTSAARNNNKESLCHRCLNKQAIQCRKNENQSEMFCVIISNYLTHIVKSVLKYLILNCKIFDSIYVKTSDNETQNETSHIYS